MLQKFLIAAGFCTLLAACSNNNSATTPSEEKKDGLRPEPNVAKDTANKVQENQTPSLQVLEKRYALVPSDPAVAYDLAFEYAQQKNAKALRLTDSLIKANAPEIEKAYYIKANYFQNINNSEAALKNYDASIAANYTFLDAYFDKGQLLFHQKHYEEALKTFAIGQKVSPATADFYYWVAKTQEAMGNKADAKMNYERAYSLDKSMIEAKEAAAKL